MSVEATREILERLASLSRERLAACRRGDLDALEACEGRRRGEIESLTPAALAAFATEDPEGLRQRLEALETSDRLVRSALREAMAQRGRELDQGGIQSRAEHAYLKTSHRSP